jgi:threonyl-tRNA synthetase
MENTVEIRIDGTPHDLAGAGTFGAALKSALSGKRFKACLAAKLPDGSLVDLGTAIPAGTTEITSVTADTAEGLSLLRHSTAHVMAAAVQTLFPGVKVTIGPSIDNGFYYDFDAPRPFTPEDFEAIEAAMQTIVKAALPYVRTEMSREEAIAFFAGKGESYKVELVEAVDAPTVSLYSIGDFTDLCRGPHLPDTSHVRAFKLLSVAGAYWRGDEKNRMLSRIYGTAFATPDDLKKYLHQLEEARKRDHRKLGRELELFDFHEDVAPGMVFWHPKGMLVRTILEDFLRKEHLKRGYELVQGPQLLRRELWEKSGHYANYRENMYFTEIEEDSYGIKPMNCLAHMMIFGSKTRSYRDMPVRFAELGVVHRHEKSGVLHGLLRVRQFTQDDAHIICRPDQLQEEITGVIRLVRDLFELFDFSYTLVVSTRPKKSIGSDEDWERATSALMAALDALAIPYTINEGDGAFYGPKIDVKVTDSLEREWQCSTIQCDFTLPDRFDLVYVGQDGGRHRPVMLHRAILGSLERFIGILIEHCAGAFPTWIAPEQARIITINDEHHAFALEVRDELKRQGLRVEADLRNEKLGYKVRAAQVEKVPFVLVIGDKELEARGVNLRLRNGETRGFMNLDEVLACIRADSDEPFRKGGMNYRFS